MIRSLWTRPIQKSQAHDTDFTSSTFTILNISVTMPKQKNNIQTSYNYHPISMALRELHTLPDTQNSEDPRRFNTFSNKHHSLQLCILHLYAYSTKS
jgi:hypothetical protein